MVFVVVGIVRGLNINDSGVSDMCWGFLCYMLSISGSDEIGQRYGGTREVQQGLQDDKGNWVCPRGISR